MNSKKMKEIRKIMIFKIKLNENLNKLLNKILQLCKAIFSFYNKKVLFKIGQPVNKISNFLFKHVL